MGQFSVEIYALPGSLLSGNQHGDILAREQPAMRDQDPALPAFAPPHPQQFEQLR